MSRKRRGSQSPDEQLIEALEQGRGEQPNDDQLKARNESQGRYVASIQTNPLTFGIGSAGTGKTFIAATIAADAIREKRARHIIVTRPVTDDTMGFLPGTLQEKFDPYFAPVRQVFQRRLGSGFTDYLIQHKHIEVIPLAYLRGHTFDDCFVIFDEAQNASYMQMKTFLTRIGERCKVVVNGDPEQIDLPGATGLDDAVKRLRDVRGVGVVTFSAADVVRSALAQRVVQAYKE